MACLWHAIEYNGSVVLPGGAASGKTTSMNAVLMFVLPWSKRISIEDTLELALYHDDWLSCVTRDGLEEGANVTMYDLFRWTLATRRPHARQSPRVQ